MGSLIFAAVICVPAFPPEAPAHPALPSRLPSPDQLRDGIANRMLNTYRSLLTSTEELRKDYEQKKDERYDQRIKELREHEADLKRRIQELERGALTGPGARLPAVMADPFDPDSRLKKLNPPPKPPIRD